MRAIILIIILSVATWIIVYLSKQHLTTPYSITFAPAFQLAGLATENVNKLVSRVLPINDLDEKQLGEVILAKKGIDLQEKHTAYLNNVLKELQKFKKKPFKYYIVFVDLSFVNAHALPGGVIVIYSGLLKVLHSESELAAIIAHEMGHIELNHCLDGVKFELAAKKIHSEVLGNIADLAIEFLLRHSFSKTQEDAADEYSFNLLLQSKYDVQGVAKAFQALYDHEKESEFRGKSQLKVTDPIRDYFMSHPYLIMRLQKFTAKSDRFYKNNPQKRYIGVKNLKNMKPFINDPYPDEWTN